MGGTGGGGRSGDGGRWAQRWQWQAWLVGAAVMVASMAGGHSGKGASVAGRVLSIASVLSGSAVQNAKKRGKNGHRAQNGRRDAILCGIYLGDNDKHDIFAPNYPDDEKRQTDAACQQMARLL